MVSDSATDKQPEWGGDGRQPKHDGSMLRHLLRSIILLVMVSLACFVIYNRVASSSIDPIRFFYTFSFSRPQNSTAPPPMDMDEKNLSLEQLLQRAAMPNKTVILTPLNEAWIEKGSIFDLFLESFKIGNETSWLLKHLMVVAVDQKAFDHCLRLHLHCHFLTTEGVDFSGEAGFMTPNYLKMVWRKIDFLRSVLEMGYSFVFTDADIMWLRNPFPHFYTDTNFQVACDLFLGNPTYLLNAPNTGLKYVISSNQTIEFYKFWYKSREFHPRKHDQDVFNMIKFDRFMKEIGLKIKFLDTSLFGGFCQPSKDLNLVCTMHANCCAGLDNKIHDLKILLDDWRNYTILPEDVKKSQPPSWSVPQNCGPASFRPRINPKTKNVTAINL